MTAGWQTELAAGLGVPVTSAAPVAGGDINDAYRVQLADGRTIFVKTQASPPADLYAAEAHGLDWLRPGPLRVPRVLASGARYLALEWLVEGARGETFDVDLGRGLAMLHQRGAPALGLDRASYLATIRQAPCALDPADVARFWVEERLRPVCRAATAAGRLPVVDRELDALRARAERFGPAEPVARLHGDLWWGNVIAVDGAPTLIDPAVYGGPREVDLAMLALFGAVPPAVYAAYAEIWPLADGWRERIPLWQLYPLAVHAALFGGGYGAQVARTLARMR